MSKIRVGILRGGPSDQYDVSLRSGAHVAKLLRHESLKDGYEPVDIYIDKFGLWHLNGVPFDPNSALKNVDVVFNTLHGQFGEDGKVQQILNSLNMPYVGSGALTSATLADKTKAKKRFAEQGIKTPYFKEMFVEKTDDIPSKVNDLFRTFPMPVVVKPRSSGSSLGVAYASNFAELIQAIDHARQVSPDIMVEEYITGKEIVSGVIDEFRGVHPYVTMPVHVSTHPQNMDVSESGKVSPKKLLDYAARESGMVEHKSPAGLTTAEKEEIESIMKTLHTSLGLKHLATADFIVSPKRGVYLIEVDTQPVLHEHAPIWKSLEAAGVKAHDAVKHVLMLALKRK